jgi:hypothetical protein
MGTRSLTKVIQTWEDESGKKQRKPFTCMYRQFDGYLDGHGLELAEWLSQYTVVNGMRIDENRKIANGMDCLAAQMFQHFKDGPGNIYCMHPDAKDCWEQYLYEVEEEKDDGILLTVYDTYSNKEIFHGTPEELLTKIESNVEH